MTRVATVALALALLVTACGDETPEEEPVARPADALTWTDDVDPDLADVPIAVGSQEGDFEEILGWIAVETLVAAGMQVTEDLPQGDSRQTREAQLAGLIDLTWETTGTGWLALLREIGPSQDPDQLYQDVRDEDLEENAIVWLPPAPADAGLGVVADPDVARDLGIGTLSDLAEALADLEDGVVVCVSSARRPLDPAGLAALADAANVRIRPRVVELVPDAELFEQTEAGTFCPFALVERLDPRLDGTDLEFLQDDLGAFVAQNPAVTIRADTEDLAPGVDDLFAPVSEALDTETLRRLVARVVDDEEEPRTVAREWLVDEGFAEEP
jgi:osmoprotectant transport system substrate-binding protein